MVETCNTLAEDRRRVFWSTQPNNGVEISCGTECGVTGLQLVEQFEFENCMPCATRAPDYNLYGNFETGKFTLGKKEIPMDEILTFQRSSIGSFFDINGDLAIAQPNELRLDYNPVSLQFRGLLIEEKRENLAWPSENLLVAQWAKTRMGVQAAGLYKNLSLNKLTPETQPQVSHQVTNNRTFAASAVDRTASITVVAKMDAAQTRRIAVRCWDTVGYMAYVYADLQLGVPVGSNNANVTCVVESMGNGFWKLLITQPVRAGATTAGVQIFSANPNSNATTNFDFNGIDSYIVTSIQFEFGSEPTSYIPTTTQSVVREADTITLHGVGVNDWHITFDNGSVQVFPAVEGDLELAWADLNRPWIKSFTGFGKNVPPPESSTPTTIQTRNWVTGLIINILQTNGRVNDTLCGVRPGSAGGHWSESFAGPGASFGNQLHTIKDGYKMSDLVKLAAQYAKVAAQKLVRYGVASKVDVETVYVGNGVVSINIVVYGTNGLSENVAISGTVVNNYWVWQS